MRRIDYVGAQKTIAGRVHETPLVHSTLLGARIGAELYLKCENLQKTGSFKPRGMLNKLSRLDERARGRGVVTISAGNAAQAIAWGAREAAVPCMVVMPDGANLAKVEASREYGAEVILHGTPSEAFAKAHEIEDERGMTFVHPFDDPDVIAGHGSVGLEILQQLPSPGRTIVVVPVGGGGLISGIAGAIKQKDANVLVFGVEPEGACSTSRSIEQGRAVHLDSVNTVADGLAAPMTGEHNFEIIRDAVEDILLVSDDQILRSLPVIYSRTKLVVEPAGAAGVAALLEGQVPVDPSDTVVAVLSGGNVDLRRLGHWLTMS